MDCWVGRRRNDRLADQSDLSLLLPIIVWRLPVVLGHLLITWKCLQWKVLLSPSLGTMLTCTTLDWRPVHTRHWRRQRRQQCSAQQARSAAAWLAYFRSTCDSECLCMYYACDIDAHTRWGCRWSPLLGGCTSTRQISIIAIRSVPGTAVTATLNVSSASVSGALSEC